MKRATRVEAVLVRVAWTIVFIALQIPGTARAFVPTRPSSCWSRSATATATAVCAVSWLDGWQFPTASGREQEQSIPYVIEELGYQPRQRIFDEIADMCITVFFNEDKNILGTPPWKDFNLGYLRRLQSADLTRRRQLAAAQDENKKTNNNNNNRSNAMFVARRVVPLSSPSARPNSPLILDTASIYNLEPSSKRQQQEYVKGEVLGFVEITEKAFGLPGSTTTTSTTTYQRKKNYDSFGSQSTQDALMRPVLTNLAVKKEARQSGVGSRLVQACEKVVLSWDHKEVLLEVEDDNEAALGFYKKRGYQQVFADPAARRFDASGFFLQKVRCTKICMRKAVGGQQLDEQVKETLDGFRARIFQTLRESDLMMFNNNKRG